MKGTRYTHNSCSMLVVEFVVDVLGHQVEGAEVNAEEVPRVDPVPYHRHEQRRVDPARYIEN